MKKDLDRRGFLRIAGAFIGAAQAQDELFRNVVTPSVLPAAGPTPESIRSTVDRYRIALGPGESVNAAGSLGTGHREINWDGNGSTATETAPTHTLGHRLRGWANRPGVRIIAGDRAGRGRHRASGHRDDGRLPPRRAPSHRVAHPHEYHGHQRQQAGDVCLEPLADWRESQSVHRRSTVSPLTAHKAQRSRV